MIDNRKILGRGPTSEIEDAALNDAALEAVADKAIAMEIGARGLRSVVEGILTDIMFEIPSDERVDKVIVTRECVTQNAKPRIHYRPRPQIDPDAVNV